ncbi:hypothetical protein [Endozoicomonas ascidiicola]|uniref:hypothetical protein n=1 Tax=Endozoicomonas ascidiicola TaxID=1698521 RepID=UPI000B2990A8|nr:hypothetical protein [Endozoicomonas ascidiicola]
MLAELKKSIKLCRPIKYAYNLLFRIRWYYGSVLKGVVYQQVIEEISILMLKIDLYC